MFGFSSLTRSGKYLATTTLMLVAGILLTGCEQIDFTAPDPPAGEPTPPLVQLIEAFMSADRSVVVRDDASEGASEISVESSACATFEWLLEVIERNDSGQIVSRTPLAQLGRAFLDVELPSTTEITASSVARILSVLSDPGPNGTEIMATVTITSSSTGGEDCDPAEVDGDVIVRQLTLLVTRPGGPLTVTLSSAEGTRVSPGESLDLSAVISGGSPILDPPLPCSSPRAGNRPANSGTPYVVEWSLTATDPMLDPDTVGTGAVFEADCLELGDGVVETVGRYTAPNVTGNVLASIVAIDARGNRSTASLSIVVGAPEPLSFAETSVDATRIAPGESTGIVVQPEGGTPPYDVVIELASNTAERIGNLQVGTTTPSTSVGCNALNAETPCEATYIALADKTGNDLIRITATDAVNDEVTTTIPLTVASAQTLSLSVIAAPPVIFFAGGMGNITATVAGGTEPYQVCFAIEPGSVDGMTLSDGGGGAGCPGIGTLTNCSCGLTRPDADSPATVLRQLTAGGNEGFVTVRVQAEDAVGDASTQFVSIDVSRFSGTGQVELTNLIVDANTAGDPLDDPRPLCLRVGDDGGGAPVETVDCEMVFTGGVGPFEFQWTASPDNLGTFDNATAQTTVWRPFLPLTGTTVEIRGQVTDTRTTAISFESRTVRMHPPADATNSGAVCDGEEVTLFGGPAGQMEYRWRDPANMEVGMDGVDTDRLLSPAIGGTYTLEILADNDCTDRATTDVIVNEIPVAEPGMDMLGMDGICGNAPIMVGAPAPAVGGTPPYDCAWTGSGAAFLSDANQCDPMFDPPDMDNATVRYELTLTVTDNSSTMCGSAGETIEIDVFPVPTAFAGADAANCADESLLLGEIPAATGGAGGYTFDWSGPCVGFLDDPTLPNPTLDAPDDTEMDCDFTLTVTDATGCVATDDVTISVESVPVPDPGMSMVGPNSVCAAPGMQVGGMPAATGGTAPYTFLWTGSCAGFLDDVNAENPFFDPPDGTDMTCTLFLTVTDGDGCDATSGAVMIEVQPSPTADAGADEDICSGDMVTIGGVTAVSGGTPPYTIDWSSTPGCELLLDSTMIENPTVDTSASAFTGTCDYTLTVTDATGCGDQDTVSVTIGENPTADAGADLTGGNGVCDNEDIAIGGSPAGTGGTPPYDFTWTGTCVDGGFVSNTGIANPTISAPDDTDTSCDATLTVTDSGMCVDSDTISVDIFPSSSVNAGPDFVGVDALCAGQMQMIGGSPTVTGGTPPYVIQWAGPGVLNLDDNTIENPTFTAPANDGASATSFNFAVQVTSDMNGCSSRGVDMMTVDVLPTTNITSQPPMMIVGDTGTSVMISLTATGDTLTFQWQFAADGMTFADLADGGSISGATTDTLTINPVDASHVGSYRCVVNGTCDGGAITSDETMLTVMCPVDPATVSTPETCFCFAPGAMDESISVVGDGDSPMYEWQKEVDGMPGVFLSVLEFNGPGMPLELIDVASATTDTLTFTSSDSGVHPGNYRCVVSNQCGSVFSDVIMVSVQSPCTGVCP